MASQQFLWKPQSESNGNLVILLPASLGGGNSVRILDSTGNVIASGSGGNLTNGDRQTIFFNGPGSQFGDNLTVEVSGPSGTFSYPISDGGSRVTAQGTDVNTISQSASSGGSSVISQDGSAPPGTVAVQVGDQTVFIPQGVDFNPEDFFLNLQQAIETGDQISDRNVQRFGQNFDIASAFAGQVSDTALNLELEGLEAFVPRASQLIREADAETNDLILSESERFDAERSQRALAATQQNVQTRRDIFDPEFRPLIESNAEAIARAEERASGVLNNTLLNDQLSRTARNQAADRATTGGFGVSSAASRNLLDRVDLATRLELQNQGEQQLQRALGTGGNLAGAFSGLLNQGVVDFQPLDISPVVRNIGADIQVTPLNEPGQVFRNQLNRGQDTLNAATFLSPEQAVRNDLSVQEFNRGIELQALAFEQDQNQVLADALNVGSDLTQAQVNQDDAFAAFNEGLSSGEGAAFDAAVAAFAAAGLGVVFNRLVSTPGGRATLFDLAKKFGINLEGVLGPQQPQTASAPGPGEPGFQDTPQAPSTPSPNTTPGALPGDTVDIASQAEAGATQTTTPTPGLPAGPTLQRTTATTSNNVTVDTGNLDVVSSPSVPTPNSVLIATPSGDAQLISRGGDGATLTRSQLHSASYDPKIRNLVLGSSSSDPETRAYRNVLAAIEYHQGDKQAVIDITKAAMLDVIRSLENAA